MCSVSCCSVRGIYASVTEAIFNLVVKHIYNKMSMGIQSFEDLVRKLMSTDNLERKEAEKVYETHLNNPGATCRAHLSIIQSEAEDALKSMSAVLMRRLIDDRSRPVEGYSNEDRESIKSTLIQVFQAPYSKILRKNIANCLSSMINATKEDKSWDSLVPFILECIEKSDDATRVSCLYLFEQIAACFIDKIVATELFPALKSALIFCLSQKQSREVKLASWECIAQCAAIMDESDIHKIVDVIPPFIAALDDVQSAEDWQTLESMLNSLVDAADNNIEFAAPYLNQLLAKTLTIADAAGDNAAVITYAVEFMLVVCENLPKKARAIKEFVHAFFNLAMKLTATVEEDEDWGNKGIDKDEEEDTTEHDVGLEALDRMAVALKGKCLAPLAQKTIMDNVNNPDWRIRQAALLCVGQIAEGCKSAFKKNLESIISLVLSNLDDSHPRVRYAALSSLAQTFTDFDKELENKYALIVPAIYKRLDDATPRIQTLAAASLCNLCDSASTKEVDAFSHDILVKVSSLLTSTPHLYVKEQCVGTISAVAENGSKHLAHFYGELLPMLTSILDLPACKDNDLLRCRALDAVTLMAVAVGKERFAPDAANICGYLVGQMNEASNGDDLFFRHVMRGWTNMVKTLEEGFSPYMDGVMQYIFRVLREPSALELDDDEEQESEAENADSHIIRLSYKGEGEKRIKLRTSLIEDKLLVLALLLLIIEKCGSQVVQYLEAIIEITTPLLTFFFTDEMKTLCARIAGSCIQSSSAFNKASGNAHTETITRFAVHLVQKLVDALKNEETTDVAIEFLAALDKILKNSPENILDDEAIGSFKNVMRQVFAEGIKRRKELFASIEDQDEEDVDDIMAEHEDEECLLIEAVDVIGSLLKTQSKFFPIFLQEFLPDFQNLLSDDMGDAEHKLALCVLDDFLEYKPETAKQLFNQIFAAMLKFSTAHSYEVMQAASYGLGLCVELLASDSSLCPANTDLRALACSIASNLIGNFSRDHHWVEECYHAIANVASCAVKLHQNFISHLPGEVEQELIQAILRVLPIRFDWGEACVVHAYVLLLVQHNAPAVRVHREKIIELLKGLIGTEAVDAQTDAALRAL